MAALFVLYLPREEVVVTSPDDTTLAEELHAHLTDELVPETTSEENPTVTNTDERINNSDNLSADVTPPPSAPETPESNSKPEAEPEGSCDIGNSDVVETEKSLTLGPGENEDSSIQADTTPLLTPSPTSVLTVTDCVNSRPSIRPTDALESEKKEPLPASEATTEISSNGNISEEKPEDSEAKKRKKIKAKGVSFTDGTPEKENKAAESDIGDLDSLKDQTQRHELSRMYSMECVTLLEGLQNLLQHYGAGRDVWTITKGSGPGKVKQDSWQITFVVDSKLCDRIIRALSSLGLGRIPDTSFSVYPAKLYYTGSSLKLESRKTSLASACSELSDKKAEFWQSVKSRLTVAEVVESVKSSASLTFDFVMFLLLASIIAALGLAENSSVILVASMLVSPIMGPILGGTFGVVIKNEGLWKMGLKNEVISLVVCLVSGFLIGVITGAVNSQGAAWGSSDQWPTSEMQGRGLPRSLWVGALVAVPSGAGVALSILGGNAGSLVGVAISASLLPPAVNAGMLWAYALVSAIHPPPLMPATVAPPPSSSDMNVTASVPSSVPYSSQPPNCPPLKDNAYQFVYSCYMPEEAAALASVSLLLTLVNIVCIIIMGILVLKLKEVAPYVADIKDTEAFWKKDMRVARDLYRTMKGPDAVDLAKVARRIAQQYKTFEEQENPEEGEGGVNVFEQIEREEVITKLTKQVTKNPKQQAYLNDAFAEWPVPSLERRHHTLPSSSSAHSDSERPSAQDMEKRLQDDSDDQKGPKTADLKRKPGTAPVLRSSENPFFRKQDKSEHMPLMSIPSGDETEAASTLDESSEPASKDADTPEPTGRRASDKPAAAAAEAEEKASDAKSGPAEGTEVTPEALDEGTGSKSTLAVDSGDQQMKKSESIGRFAITKVEDSETNPEEEEEELPQCPDSPTESQGGIVVMDN